MFTTYSNPSLLSLARFIIYSISYNYQIIKLLNVIYIHIHFSQKILEMTFMSMQTSLNLYLNLLLKTFFSSSDVKFLMKTNLLVNLI